MVIVEKSFPRGGITPKESKPEEVKENIIFGALQTKIKKPKKKPKDDEFIAGTEEENEQIQSVSAELLNYDTIQDGMTIMGVVKAIDQLYLSISLPGRMTARVSALEISDSYTKATREFLEQSDSSNNFKPLSELYHIGQIVYGRVQEVKQNEHGRMQILMSLRPNEVHSELSHTNVKKGFVFNGAIEEVQEHGYIIETGIKGLRTFLPLEKAQPNHVAGELIFLKVDKITADKAVSTCICKEIKTENMKIKNQTEPNIDYILPGTIVQFSVTKQLKDGLQGTIMNEALSAYVNEHQLAEALALPEDYEINSTLNARILYVMPLTKLVYLTLNLRTNAIEQPVEQQYKRGEIIESAKVHHLGTGGVILVLDNKFKGVLSYKSIKANFKGNYDQDEVLVKYAKKTKHKVRVLDYDPMDSLYICTDDANTVNEKIFGLDDLKPGEFVTAMVKERDAKVGGYTMQVGRVKGIIERLYLAPVPKTLEVNAKVRCRILAVNAERRTVYLTNRPEYLAKHCKVLSTLANVRQNATYMGTIVKCNEEYLLVKFFNNIKGMLYKQRLNSVLGSEMYTFYEGQTMAFRILSRNGEQITLTLADDTFGLGEICPITVLHTLESGLEIKIAYHPEGDYEFDEDDPEANAIEVKGLVPLRLLSDYPDLVYAKLRTYTPDTETQAVCIVKNIFSMRDVSYFLTHLTNNWQNIKQGDILKAHVKNVHEDIVELFVPIRNYGKLVKVHLKMLLVNAHKNANVQLTPEQVVYVKVLGKEPATRTISVTAKLTDVWDGELSSTAHYLEEYLNEVTEVRKTHKKLGLKIAQHKVGDKVSACFLGINADTNDWQYEVEKTKVLAVVKSTLVGKTKPPKVGAKQECLVLWVDYSNELVYISNKQVDVAHVSQEKHLPSNLVDKSGINAKVLLKTEQLYVCSLKKGPNPLIYCPLRLHFNDFENSACASLKEGDFCKVAFIHEKIPIAVPDNTWKLWHDIKKKRKTNVVLENEPKVKKAKIVAANETATTTNEVKISEKPTKKQKQQTVPDESDAPSKKKKKKQAKTDDILFYEDKTPNQIVIVENNADSDEEETLPNTVETKPAPNLLPGIGGFWNADLSRLNNDNKASSDEDETDNEDAAAQAGQKKKKLTAAEKFKLQREEETRLREIEAKYADPNHLPESIDQFDRLVLSEPNNSKHWINYMVYHLQSAEIEKARAVARRAIKAISYRENNEQLNIWVALLNLELRYGNKEAFDEVLKEAITYNDPLKVYLRTLEILSDAKKTQELIEMITLVTKKFKAQPEIWRATANAYFSIEMHERAQQLLHKALACLPEREHVNTIVAFGNLNHKYGNNEMAQTLLDQVVTSYPKRVDVWAQYIDMLVKSEMIDSARSVLERAIIQKIPMKKMRTIFKKYLEFEERFGTPADVEKVKKLAKEYVKRNAQL
ncbi:protein RRP5 homolog [Zeugodacus cucurbitae]|uniref:protein RRP5 homolog n=1 Tax=Zeugodacus cucurbitae TaxID=28588 RepID=UPI000596A07E|nr:protein RRP5 homolog [Zeugodacus cucurbitae]